MMTVAGLAKRLAISRASAYSLCKQGLITYYNVTPGKGIRITEEAVRDFLESRKVPAARELSDCRPAYRVKHMRI